MQKNHVPVQQGSVAWIQLNQNRILNLKNRISTLFYAVSNSDEI